jgi:anti-anti-sigma regulatory factor
VLKIVVTETETETRVILHGQLAGQWVNELRSCWKRRRSRTVQPWVVDLNDVTFIDANGERLLRTMFKKGTQFVASGIYTRHILDMVKIKGKRG